MSDKHELTEKLKKVELTVHNAKSDLRAIEAKLNASYAYEDELNQRQATAKKQTEELRTEFFKKAGEISACYKEMKDIFDVFTGNFFRD